MPILTVEVVLRDGERQAPDVAEAIAREAGKVFGSAPGTTWAKVESVEGRCYAESGENSHRFAPVFVYVLLRELPGADVLEQYASGLAGAVGVACGRRPENVHVVFEPAAAGRIAFGGRLVRRRETG